MDNHQKLTLLRAIAISTASSPSILHLITPQSRSEAYNTLEQFKRFDRRVDIILELLVMEQILLPLDDGGGGKVPMGVGNVNVNVNGANSNANGNNNVDITAATKLYMLSVLQSFLKTQYSKLSNENDRLAIRHALLTAAREVLSKSIYYAANGYGNGNGNSGCRATFENESRFLAVKLAAVIADIATRDFPQRWTTFISDIFVPPDRGGFGLWYIPPPDDTTTNASSNTNSNANTNDNGQHTIKGGGGGGNYGPLIGIKICLECLKAITEDCTDGDFNCKISTSRRNDVLIGLNEVHHQFIPLLYDLLSTQYSIVSSSKRNLIEMSQYLVSVGRTVGGMSVEERYMYDLEVGRRDTAGKIVGDCLATLEKFCQSMPTNWVLVSSSSGPSSSSSTGGGSGGGEMGNNGAASGNASIAAGGDANANGGEYDFLSALLHLLREDTCNLQILSVYCLYQLTQRKLEFNDWLRLISLLPQAVAEANEVSNAEYAIFAAAEGQTGADSNLLSLVKNYRFHRSLSKMLSQATSGYVAHITDPRVLKDNFTTMDGNGNTSASAYQIVSSFLNLLADLVSHPSGRVCGEQSNTWAVLLRDPQLSSAKSCRLIQPCLERVLVAFTTNLVRIRWSDVEDQMHPMSALMEESWEDEDSYNLWIGDFRSKANLLIRLIGNIQPRLAAKVIYEKFKVVFSTYSGGEVRDCTDPTTGQLTQKSTATMQLEGLNQPLDNVLLGFPEWALNANKQDDPSFMDPNRVEIRNAIRCMFSEIANILIAWKPVDCWLKFRRVTLLESLKYYWKYDPTTLAAGIDVFLVYLGEDDPSNGNQSLRDDFVGLRKKSGVALISVSKRIPHLLVPWIDQLSSRVKSLLSIDMAPSTRMHLFEFLSCIATAIEDPLVRSNFVTEVLSNALTNLESPAVRDAIGSVDGLLSFMGVQQAGINPALATNEEFVKQISSNFVQLFSSLNQLLSVGKRCHEAARKRPNGGIPLPDSQLAAEIAQNQHNFPDEGPVSINDLTMNDPFVHLWPRIFPAIIQILEILCTLWQPHYQGNLMKNTVQRYIYAISDDEAYLAKNQGSLSGGGVFGEGGTAGSVVRGWDRRQCNLAPKWSGWFNELRHTCIQLLGLICAQRALFSPEISSMYPRFVSVIANPDYLKAMEHRHLSQYIKQFVEYIHLCCPATLYQSHVAPIATQFFKHMEYRLKCSWSPILNVGASSDSTKPLTTDQCNAAADLALRGGEEWYISYYSRAGAYVGELDAVIGEAVVEKNRVELSRSYSDMLQTSLALKGDWNLVLANIARDEQAQKKNDASILETRPSSKIKNSSGPVNANGSKRSKFYKAIEARKLNRIHKLSHFLFLENETIAGYLVLSIAECLGYPDAYTCRRCIAISHKILENVAWVDRYTQLLGQQMFSNAIRVTVAEQKWMVGIEWDMINLIRDMYCRLVLGQYLQAGGQGSAMQQHNDGGTRFEQSKSVDKPLQGGGILCVPSDLPRQVFASLSGVNPEMVLEMERKLRENRSAKDQKEFIRDLLHTAAECIKESEIINEQAGVLGRANESESTLNIRSNKNIVPSLPEKLVTHSMVMKQSQKAEEGDAASYGAHLFQS